MSFKLHLYHINPIFFLLPGATVRVKKDIFENGNVLPRGWPDNYSQTCSLIYPSFPIPFPQLFLPLTLSTTATLVPPYLVLHSVIPHIFLSRYKPPSTIGAWRAAGWSPFCWACPGGSPWSPRGSSPHLTDAWPPWTWWPSVWAAPWGPGSTSCLERWPETPRGPASSSRSSSPLWPLYLPDCAMQSLAPGFPKQAQRTSIAMWQWENCWLSSPGGICYSPTSSVSVIHKNYFSMTRDYKVFHLLIWELVLF